MSPYIVLNILVVLVVLSVTARLVVCVFGMINLLILCVAVVVVVVVLVSNTVAALLVAGAGYWLLLPVVMATSKKPTQLAAGANELRSTRQQFLSLACSKKQIGYITKSLCPSVRPSVRILIHIHKRVCAD